MLLLNNSKSIRTNDAVNPEKMISQDYLVQFRYGSRHWTCPVWYLHHCVKLVRAHVLIYPFRRVRGMLTFRVHVQKNIDAYIRI